MMSTFELNVPVMQRIGQFFLIKGMKKKKLQHKLKLIFDMFTVRYGLHITFLML